MYYCKETKIFEAVFGIIAVTAVVAGLVCIPYAVHCLMFLPVNHPHCIALKNSLRKR